MELPGYRRNSRNNAVYPGFAEVNANKKTCGATNSNIVPVVTLKDAIILLNSVTVTWRRMGSKLIEICTSSGVWEPCKLQLNFILQTLAALEWSEHIRPENQDLWKYPC